MRTSFIYHLCTSTFIQQKAPLLIGRFRKT
nr:MAG TPA: hypothetical protein [Caudoviricetes sp.]